MEWTETQAIKAHCEELVLNFAVLNDTRRYDEVAQLFAPDGVFYRPLAPQKAVQGRAAIVEDLRRKPPNLHTIHVCTNILVTVLGSTQARGISYFTVYLHEEEPDAPWPQALKGTVYVGQYEDDFALVEGRWCIQTRRGTNRFYLQQGAKA